MDALHATQPPGSGDAGGAARPLRRLARRLHIAAACRATLGRSAATAAFFAVVVAAAAAWFSTLGLNWSLGFHPDEMTIVRWIDQTRDEGYITERAYPSGWFELFRLRLFAEKKLEKAGRDWRSHYVQEGVVNASNPRSFRPAARNPPTEPENHCVQDGRDFNAFLYVLSALLLYAACLESGLRPVSAFASALFFFASPSLHEFSRYCETDAALVVSLCFFAWTSARALRRNSPAFALVSGFAAGFATACKFTLAPLLFWCAVLPAAIAARGLRDGGRGQGARRAVAAAALLALGALACAAAGYAMGTPALVHDPEWYLESLRSVSRGTYAEILANLGGVRSRWGADVLRARHLARELAKIGLLPLAWGLFSWTFWWRRGMRRQAAGVALLLPAFPFFAVFCCPFVRTQETLPLAVVLALGSALPLEWLLRREGGRIGALPAAAAALFGISALAVGASRAAATVSCFRQRDTQVEAQNWLRSSIRHGLRIGFDSYVARGGGALPGTPVDAGGLPYFWKGPQTKPGFGYYLENVGFEARHPIRSLKTGALKPEVSRSLALWNSGATFPLAEWRVGPGFRHPTFAQQTARLHSFSLPRDCEFDVPLGYPRPVCVLPDGASLYDFRLAPGLGAHRAIHLVGRRSTVYCRPDFGDAALVTLMPEGTQPARVLAEGLFRPGKAVLDAGGAVAAPLRPTALERLLANASARPSTRVRMRGDDQNLFCVSFLADTVEAARQLRAAGNPRGALALLRERGTADDASRVEAFLAASAAGAAQDPAWRRAAESAVAAADRLRRRAAADGPKARVSLRGVPLDVAADFSHVRVDAPHIVKGFSLPVFLPAGRYGVSVRFPSGVVPDESLLALIAGLEAPLARTVLPDGTVRYMGALAMRRMARPVFSAGPDPADYVPDDGEPGGVGTAKPVAKPVEILSAEIEFSWDPLSRALAAAEEVRRALRQP